MALLSEDRSPKSTISVTNRDSQIKSDHLAAYLTRNKIRELVLVRIRFWVTCLGKLIPEAFPPALKEGKVFNSRLDYGWDYSVGFV
jgi:hypothetical protein